MVREKPRAHVRFRRDMLVAEAVDADPRVKDLLMEFGLPCHRCIVAYHETLEEGCKPLGLEVERILERLNALPGRPPGETRSPSSPG